MQIGNARNVMTEEIIYTGAYELTAKSPSNAGPKPIVASQNMKNVETAYERLFSEVFLVTIVVHAELRVPNPNAAQTAQITTVMLDGATAINKSPMLCAMIPTTQIIKSP